MDKEKKFTCGEITFSNAISLIETGKMKIPKFQREYVWDTKQIIGLLNSILETTPLGTIVTWETREKLSNKNEILELINSHSLSSCEYVIDGQQRITTIAILWKYSKLKKNELARKLISKRFEKIFYDIDQKQFVCISKRNILSNKHISIDKFFEYESGSEKKINYLKENFIDENIVYEWEEIIDKFKKYQLSVIKLDAKYDLDEVIRIFEKINTKGVRLTFFDVINAKWSNIKFNGNDKKTLEDIFDDFNKDERNKLRGIDNEVLLDSLFIILKEKNKPIIKAQDKINYNYEENINYINEQIKIWYVSALRATTLLVNDCYFNIKTLPSTNIFKWLVYLFFKNNNNEIKANERTNIIKYIYLLCINNFYEKTTTKQLEENINFIDNGFSNQFDIQNLNLKKTIDDEVFTTIKSSNDMNAKLITSILLREAEDFKLGKNVNDQYQLHHIYPKNGYKHLKDYNEIKDGIINSFANLTPIDEKTNKEIQNTSFSAYSEKLRKDNSGIENTFKTHFIDFNDFKNDNSIECIKQAITNRSRKLAKKINDFISK